MGDRHVVISDTTVPKKDKLPRWFIDKYETLIDFSEPYWRSYLEYKRYSTLREFNTDVQKVTNELKHPFDICLVYYSDGSQFDDINIIHTRITEDRIYEVVPTEWGRCTRCI